MQNFALCCMPGRENRRTPICQLLLMIKLTAILLLAATLSVSARVVAQNVTLNVNNATLEKVFFEIEKQTGFNFVYNTRIMNMAKPVTISVSDVAVDEVLKLAFKDQPLNYLLKEKTIVITAKSPIVSNLELPVLLPLDVKGVVRDESGKPAVGVAVQVKGTNKGTTTNMNGEFTLTGVDDNAILVFSSVNLQTFEVKVQAGKANDIAVTLKAKISELGEIAVTTVSTGIQEIPKERSTGSFGFISNQTIDRTVSTDIISRINGTTSGLVVSNSSNPRLAMSIRSASTIIASKQPLVVVDNFPFDGDLNSINPNDVESVTVLKDAAAASIWGVLAGNGVVVITTKKGKYNQKTKLSFNSSVRIADKPDLFYTNSQLSGKDYVDVETFLFGKGYYNSAITSTSMGRLTPAVEILLSRRNGLISSSDSATQIDRLKQYDVRNDLSKYYYRQAVSQQHALNISGGSANQQYFASIGLDNNLNGTIANDYQRVTINGNNTYSLLKGKMEISTSLWYAQTNSNAPSAINSTYPYARLADENGNPLAIARYRNSYIDTIGSGKLLDWHYYPIDDILHSTTQIKNTSLRFGTEVKYKVLTSFNVSLRYSYEKGSMDTRNLNDVQSFFARDLINRFSSINYSTGVVTNRIPVGGVLDVLNDAYTSQGLRGQLNYANKWKAGLHSLNGLIGTEIRELNTNGYAFRTYGYNTNNLTSVPVDFITLYPTIITGSTQAIPNNNNGFYNKTQRVVSVFSNLAYTYKDRYTLSASARRDGSNQFGVSTNNKWKPLWSTGLGWNLSKESFYHISWLPTLRLRATYGFQGNIDYSTAALLTIRQTQVNAYSTPFSTINNSPNPNLGWEQVRTINAGVDFGLFKNRLTGSIEYFRKNGTDLIGSTILPPSAGVSSFKTNSADIKGEGLEVTFNYRAQFEKFEWLTTFNFSYAQDWVTDYKNALSSTSTYVVSGGNSISGFTPIVGNPVSAVYSYRWAGLDPSNGDPQGFVNKQISKDYASLINSSNLSDMVYSGSYAPKYFGNFLNSINYRQFALSFNILYKIGFVFRRNSLNYANLFSGGATSNDYTKRWQKPGDEQFTNVPSLVYPGNSSRDQFYTYSEALIDKGDYIRLQDIRISFSFPNAKLDEKRLIRNLQVFGTISNIGYLWKSTDRNIDPENPTALQKLGPTYSAGIKLEL